MSLETKKTVTCRKWHSCQCCGYSIFKGEKAVYHKGLDVNEGRFYSAHLHLICDKILRLVEAERDYSCIDGIAFHEIMSKAELLDIIYLEGEIRDESRRWRWVKNNKFVFEGRRS